MTHRLLSTCLISTAALAMSVGLAGAQPATPPAADPAAAAQPSGAPAAPTATAPAAAPSAATPSTDASDKVPPPPPGKGQVVFFRPSKFVGMAVSFSIHEGDAGIGKLGNGSYFIMPEDPGPHTFSIQFEATDTLHVEVDAGETQYVQQTIGVGVVAARPHLTPSDKATFDSMPKLKLSDKKPTDLKSASAK